MQALATSPEGILQKLADTALKLCRAHFAGLSLLEDTDQKSNFHWRAIAGQWAPYLSGGTPRNFGPCGTVLDRNAAIGMLVSRARLPLLCAGQAIARGTFLIPFYVKGEVVGTVWVVARDTKDLRVMTNLGAFAAAAYQMWLSLNATQRIVSIVESSDDAIVSKDLNGIISTWNKAAERIFGYAAKEVIGKPITILIPPERIDEERKSSNGSEAVDVSKLIRPCACARMEARSIFR